MHPQHPYDTAINCDAGYLICQSRHINFTEQSRQKALTLKRHSGTDHWQKITASDISISDEHWWQFCSDCQWWETKDLNNDEYNGNKSQWNNSSSCCSLATTAWLSGLKWQGATAGEPTHESINVTTFGVILKAQRFLFCTSITYTVSVSHNATAECN